MTLTTHPPILSAPVVPGAIPCFRQFEPDAPAARPARQAWDERCTRILAADPRRSNAEVAAVIEAATGLRFSASVITRHRRALGLERPRHNEWTSALRRWRPWQGSPRGDS